MSTTAVPPANNLEANQRPLNEFERVTKVFYSPSQTFADLRRNANWIVPFLLTVIFSLTFSYSVGKKIGWEQVVENAQKVMSPAQIERMEKAPPEQQQTIHNSMVNGYHYGAYAFSLIALVFELIIAALYLATMNFGLGAELKYKYVLAAVVYASLPRILYSILATIGVWTFIDPGDFQMRTPLATNPAVFINPTDHAFLYSWLANFDIFALWSTALVGIALAVLSRKSMSTCMVVAFGWLIVIATLFSIPSLF